MSRKIQFSVRMQLALLLLFGPLVVATQAAIDLEQLKKREHQVQTLVQKVLPCTVCIRSPRGQGSGSGVVVSADGLILTAAHVTAATGKELVIIFPDGRQVKGKSLGANRDRDAGMAKITDEGQYEFVDVGKSKELEKNHWCVSLGHAGGFDAQRTPPVRIGRVIANQRFIVSDCTLIGGDSGGPLFDLDGRLIGIHSNIGASLTQNQHVPIDVYHTDWERMEKGEVWGRPLGGGVSPNSPVMGVQLNPEPVEGGVGLVAVVPGSPAAKAGLQAEDIIMQVDGKKVAAMNEVVQQVRKKKAGQEVSLKVRRGEETLDVSVKLIRARDLRPPAPPARLKPNQDKPGEPAKPDPDSNPETDDDSTDDDSTDDDSTDDDSTEGDNTDDDSTEDDSTNDNSTEGDNTDENNTDENSTDDDNTEDDGGQDDAGTPEGAGEGDEPGKQPPAEKPKGPRSVQELLEEARRNGGRLQMTPEEMQRLQQHMAKRMGRGGFRPPIPTGRDEWFEEMINAYVPIVAQAASSTYKVLVDGKHTALATAVTDHTLVTKASEIDDKSFDIEVAKDKTLAGRVVKTFPAYDLALVSVTDNVLTPAQLQTEDTEFLLGTFVAAVDEEDEPSAIGVISVESRSLKKAKQGYLGVGLQASDNGIAVRQVVPKSPAHKAGLKVGDAIVTIGDQKVETAEQLAKIIGAHKPGDKVVFQVRRGEKELSVRVELADRSSAAAMRQSRLERMNRMGGKLSETRGGFALALQHDCPLPPADCGGPLVNLDGEVIGINIARAGRIKSFAIPADVVQELLTSVSDEPELMPADVKQPVLDRTEPAVES